MAVCEVCGEPRTLTRTLSVTIQGLETKLHFTSKPAEEKTAEDVDNEIAFYARYKVMYSENIVEVDRRVADLNALSASIK